MSHAQHTHNTRYARYLCQWNRCVAIRGERDTAQAHLDRAREIRTAARNHRDEMLAQAHTPRWWPFTTRRQAQAHRAAQQAMKVIEDTSRQIGEYERDVTRLTNEHATAEREASFLRAEWDAEYTARARYEAGEAPRDHAERGLFAEFRRQDNRAAQGPEGRRVDDALKRYRQGRTARTAEERDWYSEWATLDREQRLDAWEAQQEANRRSGEFDTWSDEAPF